MIVIGIVRVVGVLLELLVIIVGCTSEILSIGKLLFGNLEFVGVLLIMEAENLLLDGGEKEQEIGNIQTSDSRVGDDTAERVSLVYVCKLISEQTCALNEQQIVIKEMRQELTDLKNKNNPVRETLLSVLAEDTISPSENNSNNQNNTSSHSGSNELLHNCPIPDVSIPRSSNDSNEWKSIALSLSRPGSLSAAPLVNLRHLIFRMLTHRTLLNFYKNLITIVEVLDVPMRRKLCYVRVVLQDRQCVGRHYRISQIFHLNTFVIYF